MITLSTAEAELLSASQWNARFRLRVCSLGQQLAAAGGLAPLVFFMAYLFRSCHRRPPCAGAMLRARLLSEGSSIIPIAVVTYAACLFSVTF